MLNIRQKEDPIKGGRKAQQSSRPASPTMTEANAASTLDATLLQSMMVSLKSDIFGKIDALSTSLHSEIFSGRQDLKNLIEPLQLTPDAHGETVRELEHAALG